MITNTNATILKFSNVADLMNVIFFAFYAAQFLDQVTAPCCNYVWSSCIMSHVLRYLRFGLMLRISSTCPLCVEYKEPVSRLPIKNLTTLSDSQVLYLSIY